MLIYRFNSNAAAKNLHEFDRSSLPMCLFQCCHCFGFALEVVVVAATFWSCCSSLHHGLCCCWRRRCRCCSFYRSRCTGHCHCCRSCCRRRHGLRMNLTLSQFSNERKRNQWSETVARYDHKNEADFKKVLDWNSKWFYYFIIFKS